jgi:hypothetical protein
MYKCEVQARSELDISAAAKGPSKLGPVGGKPSPFSPKAACGGTLDEILGEAGFKRGEKTTGRDPGCRELSLFRTLQLLRVSSL